MATIRLGIVGLGRFALYHVDCLRQIPQVEIAAVCDTRAAEAEAWGRRLACPAYTDPREMLRAEQLDALDVLTPEALHYDPVMAGLEAGCHVFVEKPFDVDYARAQRMAEFAARKDRQLMVGHVTRFDPRYVRMKQAIESGAIGRVRSIYARRSDRREYFGLYKRTPTVYTLGVHDIDQTIWYLDALPDEVYAVSSSSAEGEDLVNAVLTYRDGTIAMLDCNWLTPAKWTGIQDQLTQITGDAGVLKLQNPDQAYSLVTDETSDSPYFFTVRNIHGKMEGPLMAELTHFAECVAEGRPSTVLRTEDALNVIRVADAIGRSCAERRPVRIGAVTF